MQQNLLEEYTDFVDKVTSEASKSSDKMRERINYLNSKDIEMSRSVSYTHLTLPTSYAV